MKQSILFSFFLILFCVFISSIEAQSNYQKILAATFPEDGTGSAAILVKDGDILFHSASGMANLELNVPMNKGHRFRLGSITKQFTAVAILQLMEAGKLSLQDEITKFLPDYHTQGKTITVEHLLTHTSGIKSYTSLANVMEKEVRTDYSPAEVIEFFQDEPFDFEPGTDWRYNNSGYFLLGAIIEDLSEMSYANYLQKNIFDPLGLKNITYDYPKDILLNRVPGYEKEEGGLLVNAPYLSMTIPYSAGALLSDVNDLYLWNKGLLEGKLISKKSLEKAQTSYKINGEKTDYGYGWGVGEMLGYKAVEHGGGINGFLTSSMYLPEQDLFVAIFSNCLCLDPEEATLRMVSEALGKSVEFTPIVMSVEELKEYEGIFVIEAPDDKRFVLLKGEGLITQRRIDGRQFSILPYAKDKFFYPDSRTVIHFERDADGKIKSQTVSPIRGTSNMAQRTTESLPDLSAVMVDRGVLERYVGSYLLSDINATLNVFLEEATLYGELVGQTKEQLSPRSDTEFVVPTLGVKIIFEEGSPAPGLTLEQGGQKLVGKRN